MIPVQRPDKNGVMVTRWVKPDSSAGGSKGLPAPSRESTYRLGSELSGSLNAAELVNVGIDRKAIIKRANDLPEVTASALRELREKSFSQYTVDAIITSALHHRDSPEMLENIALLYNDYQYQDLDWEYGQHVAYQIISRDIRGLLQYPQFNGVTNFSDADENVQRHAKTLVKLMYEAEKDGSAYVSLTTHEGAASYLSNPEFVQMAFDNSDTDERADMFLDAVYDRGCSPEVLRDVLDTTVPLRNGVL